MGDLTDDALDRLGSRELADDLGRQDFLDLADLIAEVRRHRAAADPTAPPPGHVCPASYALGPEDLDRIEVTRAEMARFDFLPQIPELIATLDKILAAHRCPEPERPLPEVIQCAAPGCVSSIRKSYLPSGWVAIDGAWRCPRCKLEVPS